MEGCQWGLGVLEGVSTYLPVFGIVMWWLWGHACSAALPCLVSLWLPADVLLVWARQCPYHPHMSG